MLSFIHRVTNYLLDLVLPRHCLGCGASGRELCDLCLDRLPIAGEIESGIWSLYYYQTPMVKNAIWQLKYRGAMTIGERLGQELYRQFSPYLNLPDGESALVLPIPLSARRQRERGFNQAAVIARAFADQDASRLRFDDGILIKVKDTATQVSIKSRAARLKNLKRAFTVHNPQKIAGRKIMLVDDVTTTGGTINEAKRALRRAGAKAVSALTIAHG